MSYVENEKTDLFYNLSPDFKDLIQAVIKDGTKFETVENILDAYGKKRKGDKIVEEIDLILSLAGIKAASIADYNLNEEIELIARKNRGLKAKFCKLIEEVHDNGEKITTPKNLIDKYNKSTRRGKDKKLVDDIQFVLKLSGIKSPSFHVLDCGINDEIKLTSQYSIQVETDMPDNIHSKLAINNATGSYIRVETDTPDIIHLKSYQSEAITKLNDKMGKGVNKSVAGILVLPTGAGKTITIVRWLLNQAVNKNIKILWIAHRHELIDQAADTFVKNAGIVKSKKEILIRKISGLTNHDGPRHISGDEDIIIASVMTLARNETNLKFLNKFLKTNDNEKIFLVIDEAHHSVAKTYKKIINHMKSFKHLRIIGLTATPYRTSEEEMGALSNVFKDGIIHSVDLQKLISQGYLARPIHNSVSTNFNIEREIEFDKNDIKLIEQFKELPKKIITSLSKNTERRKCVTDTYLGERNKWGKTIIFALNQHDAIAIDKLLHINNIKSDYVIAGMYQRNLQQVSNIENKEKIENFRNGNLDVLVNVNILTEGFDAPNIQSVFLTRPTKSKTLMTQMVGRGLRGPEMGGTKTVNLVSFVDNWENLVGWITPKELLPPSEIKDIKVSNYEKKIPYFISEKLIQDYARMLYEETLELKNLEFIQRIPIGWYGFDLIYLNKIDDEQDSTPIYVLVYENQQQSYENFIMNLNEYDKLLDDSDVVDLSKKDIKKLKSTSEDITTNFFVNCSSPIPICENIQNILKYYIQTGNTPKFYSFEERDKFDINKIAKYVVEEKKFDAISEKNYLIKQFENPMWKQLFGNNFEVFKNEYDLAKDKMVYPEKYQSKLINVNYEQKDPQNIHNVPDELRQKVLKRDNNKCVNCGATKYLQIDHIKPFSKGGDTIFENLQTLCKKCNAQKGDTEIPYLK